MASMAPVIQFTTPASLERTQPSGCSDLSSRPSPTAGTEDAGGALTARDRSRRDRVIARWRHGLARLASLDDAQRARYDPVVDAVCTRLHRYNSIDLLITTYFQGSDFAAEAIRSLYPNEPRVWDVFWIEDAAWGRRLTELGQSSSKPAGSSAGSPCDEASAHGAQGRRCLEAWDFAGARAAFRTAASLAPDVPDYWEQLGVACGRLGEWRWAKDAFERATRIAATPRRETYLAEVQAIRRLQRKLVGRSSDAAAHLKLGALLMAWDHGDLALAHFERTVALAPRWSEAHLHCGLELHYREEWDAAAAAYRNALALDPHHPRGWRLLDACRRHHPPLLDDDPLESPM